MRLYKIVKSYLKNSVLTIMLLLFLFLFLLILFHIQLSYILKNAIQLYNKWASKCKSHHSACFYLSGLNICAWNPRSVHGLIIFSIYIVDLFSMHINCLCILSWSYVEIILVGILHRSWRLIKALCANCSAFCCINKFVGYY